MNIKKKLNDKERENLAEFALRFINDRPADKEHLEEIYWVLADKKLREFLLLYIKAKMGIYDHPDMPAMLESQFALSRLLAFLRDDFKPSD